MKKFTLLSIIFLIIISLFIGCNTKSSNESETKSFSESEYDAFLNEVKYIQSLNVTNYPLNEINNETSSFLLEIMYFYPKNLKDPIKDNVKEIIFDDTGIQIHDVSTLNNVETESYILSSIAITGVFLNDTVCSETIKVKLTDNKIINIPYGKLINLPPNLSNFEYGESSNFDLSGTLVASKDDYSILGINNLSNNDITVLDIIVNDEYFSLDSNFKSETFSTGIYEQLWNINVKPLDKKYINFSYTFIVKYSMNGEEFYFASALPTRQGLYYIDYSDELLENSTL